MRLKERYERSFAYWQDKNDGGWEDWFDADITSDLAWPAEAEFCDDLIAEMLNAGETPVAVAATLGRRGAIDQNSALCRVACLNTTQSAN